MELNITGEQFIGFARYKGEANDRFSSISAKDSTALPYLFYNADVTMVDKAVGRAESAFEEYRKIDTGRRVSFLLQIAKEISLLDNLLIDITAKETALSETRLRGERQRTVNQINLFARLLEEGSWVNAIIDISPSESLKASAPDIRQMQVPLGVVGVFGSSNFPYAFSVAGGDTIAALAAGCTVVYKAHRAHPATSELVAECIIKAAKSTGMPDGVFSLVQGGSHEVGHRLAQHPIVRAIAFTGSFTGGKALYDAAVMRDAPIPVYAEMGSVNPVFLLPSMLKEKSSEIAEALAASNTLGVGQFCTNPGLLLMMESETANDFINHYSYRIKQEIAQPMLTENIRRKYEDGIKKFLESDVAELTAKGIDEGVNATAIPHVFQISGAEFLKKEQFQEEVFGPFSLMVIADSSEQLLEVAKRIKGQLTVTIWGNEVDYDEFQLLGSLLQEKAGRIIWNGVPTGVEVCHAMVHGGPFPATTNLKVTSVGSQSIYRFTRPICYQGFPDLMLPDALKSKNPLGIWRKLNGQFSTKSI